MTHKDYLQKTDPEIASKYKLALEKQKNNRLKQSRQLFTEIITHNKGFVPAYNRLGIIAIYENDFQQAQQFLEQALQLDEEYLPAMLTLGNLYQKKNKLQQAKEIYQQIINKDKKYGAAYNNLAAIYKKEGNSAEAIKYMKKARKYGSLNYELEKPLYKEPRILGAVLFLIVFIVIIISFFV